MSKNKFKKKIFLNKYLNIKNIIFFFLIAIITIPFVVIFVYVIDKEWYDGISVISIIYISLGLLILIFDIAKFKTFYKIKKLFAIKKENNEPFNSFEKKQMKILKIKNEEEFDKNKKNNNLKERFIFLSISMIIYGSILLFISLPFIFI